MNQVHYLEVYKGKDFADSLLQIPFIKLKLEQGYPRNSKFTVSEDFLLTNLEKIMLVFL